MFHGTETVPAAAREAELLRMGADDNAWTWLDETVFHVLLPADDLPRLVTLEADRFQHLKLVPEGVRREAGAVYGEFRKGPADPGRARPAGRAPRPRRLDRTGHAAPHDGLEGPGPGPRRAAPRPPAARDGAPPVPDRGAPAAPRPRGGPRLLGVGRTRRDRR